MTDSNELSGSASLILVVDDEEPARRLLCRILEGSGHRTVRAAGVDEAMRRVSEGDIALVITDLDMPGRSGIDLIRDLAQNHPDVATMMVTGKGDRSIAESVLGAGAFGYLSKPLEPDEVVINVFNALRLRALEIENRQHRRQLEDMVRARTSELWNTSVELEHALESARASQEETIQRLALAAEFRDDETAAHNKRMSRYCGLLAERAGESSLRAEMIRVAALMHDIGKLGVPDQVLTKPGPLTEAERALMRTHTETGNLILADSESDLLRTAAAIAWTHHEWFDGSGYPRGLRGTEILLEGRIAAIADVFDALTTTRPYSDARPLTEAVAILRKERGTHFDPELLDLFLGDLSSVVRLMQSDDQKEILV